MGDITIEQLQEVLGGSMTNLVDRLEAQQKTQSTSLGTILKQVVGQSRSDIERYEKTLTDKFSEISNYIKDLTKEISKKQNQPNVVAPVVSSTATDGDKTTSENKSNVMDGIRAVTLNSAVNGSTRAIPVRVIEALNLKKVKEIDNRHKNEVDIDIPSETRVWLENLLFDNFKGFTDNLFERPGGLLDIFGAVNNIGKLGSANAKKDDESWLSKLLKGLGIAGLLEGLAAAIAALTGVAALIGGAFAPGGFGKGRIGKALTAKAKSAPEEKVTEEEVIKEKPKTETEEALKKANEKITQKEQEFAEKNLKVEEQIEELNEDLLAKRREIAKATQASDDLINEEIEAKQNRQNALAEAEEKSIKAKETKADIDIKAAEDAKIIAEDATIKATEANVRLQESYVKLDAIRTERYELEQKINTLETEQLKTIDEHNAEIENIKEGKSTKPLGEKTKAVIPEEATKAADLGKSVENTAGTTEGAAEGASSAAKNAAKASAAVAKISKVAKVGGAVAIAAGAGLEAYEGSKEFTQINEDVKAKKISEEEARKRKEDVVGGRAGAFTAKTGGAIAGGIAAGEIGAALGLLTGPAAVVVSPLLALGFGIAGSIYGEKAVKAFKLDEMASEVGKKISGGIGELNAKNKNIVKDQNLSNLGSYGPGKGDADFTPTPAWTLQSAPVALAEQPSQLEPVEPVDQYKKIFTAPQVDTGIDGINDMSDSLDEHSTLLKGLIEYQKQTATNTKELIQAFLKSQGNGGNVSVNNVNSSTNIISSPVTSSAFRQSILQR